MNKDIIDELKDIQASILDLTDKVDSLRIDETNFNDLWENKRLDAYRLAEITSKMADDLSYSLCDQSGMLGNRIWKAHMECKEQEEVEEYAYENHPAYLSNAQRGLC